MQIYEFQRAGFWPECLLPEQTGTEGQPALFHKDTEFADAHQDVFFHLAGHTGLLRSPVLWGVRIGIGREGAIHLRRLVDADTLTDLLVMQHQLVYRMI